MNRTQVKTALIAIGAFVVLQVIGGLLFMVSGTYNIAADEPHLTLVRWMLQAGRTRAVEMRSHGLHPPNLRDPALLKHGFVLYQKNCQPCHGAPGTANQQLGRGINPKPPPLLTASNKWNDSELFWIASHGLKLSGMPGFAPRLSETDVWGIIAFLRRVVLLFPPTTSAWRRPTTLHSRSRCWIGRRIATMDLLSSGLKAMPTVVSS